MDDLTQIGLQEETTEPMEDSLTVFKRNRSSLSSFSECAFGGLEVRVFFSDVYYSFSTDMPVLRFETAQEYPLNEAKRLEIVEASELLGRKISDMLDIHDMFAIKVDCTGRFYQ